MAAAGVTAVASAPLLVAFCFLHADALDVLAVVRAADVHGGADGGGATST